MQANEVAMIKITIPVEAGSPESFLGRMNGNPVLPYSIFVRKREGSVGMEPYISQVRKPLCG